MTIVIFFSSRRRHTRCALVTGVQTCALPIWPAKKKPAGMGGPFRFCREQQLGGRRTYAALSNCSRSGIEVGFVSTDVAYRDTVAARLLILRARTDRKSVLWGKSVAVRVDFGGRRIIKKKKRQHIGKQQ